MTAQVNTLKSVIERIAITRKERKTGYRGRSDYIGKQEEEKRHRQNKRFAN